MEETKKVEETKRGGFAFGMMIFGIFIIIPLAFVAGVAYDMQQTHEVRMECLKQNKTYVNSMCLPINTAK